MQFNSKVGIQINRSRRPISFRTDGDVIRVSPRVKVLICRLNALDTHDALELNALNTHSFNTERTPLKFRH